MRIAIASDHGGFKLKEYLKKHLKDRGYEIADFGAVSEERSDYPDFAKKASKALLAGDVDRAIMVCGSGIGMCMAANRFNGVRAAVLRDNYDAEMSRKHNNANVACLGERVTPAEKAGELIDLFLSAEFEGGRHEQRVAKIDN